MNAAERARARRTRPSASGAAKATWALGLVVTSSWGCANALGLESDYERAGAASGGSDGGPGGGSGGISASGGSSSAGGLRVREVASGSAHVCALRPDDTLVCWGGFTPGIDVVPAGSFDALFSGVEQSCALRAGYATCWGSSASSSPPNVALSSLGIGNQFACGVRVSDGGIECWGDFPPTPPSGSFAAVVAGTEFVCGLRDDGSVACASESIFGAPLPPNERFSSLAAVNSAVCGLTRESRTLVCFGDESTGEIGGVPTGPFESVSSGLSSNGLFAVCGLRSGGTIECFGDGASGVTSPPAGSFTQVSVGGDFACARDGEGRVQCWGASPYGATTLPSE